MVYLLVERPDENSRSWWERSLKKVRIETVDQLTTFERTFSHFTAL